MMKELVKRYLSEDHRKQIRNTQARVLEAVKLVREGKPTIPPVHQTGTDFSAVVQAIRSAPQTEEALRALIEHVLANASWWPVLEGPFLKGLLSEEFYAHAIAAAKYGAGDVKGSLRLFEAQLAKNGRELTYHCAARCAAQFDDVLAKRFLVDGLKSHPDSLALTLALAACHFRAGETAEANRVFEAKKAAFVELTSRGLNAASFEPLKAEIAEAVRNGSVVRPAVGYSEASAENYWCDLWFNMTMLTPHQSLWSWLNHHYQTWIGDVLTRIAPDAQEIINFGVFCAEPDYRLALRYPDREFYGVDREQITKTLNDAAYKAKNLHFVKGEIMTSLPEIADGNKRTRLLLHGRTGCLFYPEFLRNLYKECARNGVQYICLHENISLSRSELKYYDFDTLPSLSIAYMNTMLIHNYRDLLASAGYKIVEMKATPYMYLLDRDEVLGDSHVFLTAKLESSTLENAAKAH